MDPASSNSCSSKVNCISPFCNHVLIVRSLNYSRISWGHSTLQGSVNTCDSKNPCSPSFLYNYWIKYQFFFQPKCVMESWLHLNHSNSTNSPRKFFLISRDRNHPVIFSAIMTLKLYVLVFCFCVLSHLTDGKVFDGRARVTQVCILYHRSGGWW